MPGYRVRLVRNDGKVVYDSGGAEARITASIFDAPGPGDHWYTLQVQGVGSVNSNYLTYDNGVGIIKLNR